METNMQDKILRETAQHYGIDHATGKEGIDLLKNQNNLEEESALEQGS